MPDPCKVYVQGMVDKQVYNRFVKNTYIRRGPKKGFKGIALEESLVLFNTYMEIWSDSRILEVCQNMDVDPLELGKLLLETFINTYEMMKVEMPEINDKQHSKMALDYINQIANGKITNPGFKGKFLELHEIAMHNKK